MSNATAAFLPFHTPKFPGNTFNPVTPVDVDVDIDVDVDVIVVVVVVVTCN